ncbi:MAG: hypothetical protein U0P30_13985, partial [Vicinamibacterales bacterium]
MTSTLWLSCHVHYACRHSGVCCTAGWPLPVEDTVVPAIDDAVTRGRLTTIDGRTAWLLESAEAPPGMAGTLRQRDGACVFHRPRAGAPPESASHECAVHATLGYAALPSTCQHFPRVALIDDRGVRVSLSHVCPTALDLLASQAGPVTIVPGPSAVPGRETPEGLDARGELPPALNDRVLMDLETLTLWEAHVVETLAGPDAVEAAIDDVVAALMHQASVLAAWTPRRGSLAESTREILARPLALARVSSSPGAAERTHARVAATCRPPWTWAPSPDLVPVLDAWWVEAERGAFSPLIRRYLATRAFGAWAQYQAGGLVASASWLRTVLDVLRVEAARAAAAAGRP